LDIRYRMFTRSNQRTQIENDTITLELIFSFLIID